MDRFPICLCSVWSCGPAVASGLPRMPAARVKAVTQMDFMIVSLLKVVFAKKYVTDSVRRRSFYNDPQTKAEKQKASSTTLYLYLFVS